MKKIIDLLHKLLNSRLISNLFQSYRIIWELAGLTKEQAMDAVLRNFESEEKFWASGIIEAEKLKNFVDKNFIVLDVGCGIGRIEKYLADYCREIYAVDVSGRMIKNAKNLVCKKNVFFAKNNGKDLSIFPDDRFDFVFSVLVLQHIEKEDAYIYIEEIYRVLKPGKKTYLQFPNFLDDEVFRWFVDYARKRSRHIARVRGYTVAEVEKMMASAGFRDLDIRAEKHDIIAVGRKDL